MAGLHVFEPDPDHPDGPFGLCCTASRGIAGAHYQQPVILPGGAVLGDKVADLELVKQSGCCCRWIWAAPSWARDVLNLACPVHAQPCPACDGTGRIPT